MMLGLERGGRSWGLWGLSLSTRTSSPPTAPPEERSSSVFGGGGGGCVQPPSSLTGCSMPLFWCSSVLHQLTLLPFSMHHQTSHSAIPSSSTPSQRAVIHFFMRCHVETHKNTMTSRSPTPPHLDNDTLPQPADLIRRRAACRSIGNRIRHEFKWMTRYCAPHPLPPKLH